MESPILFDGKEYISASRASKKIGYASDYIGQLCRAKKIPGRLIGRTWYVDLDSLVEHKKNRQYGRKKIFDTEPEPLELLTPPFYVESVWNVRLLKKAAATSLVIFTVIGSSFFLEHKADPPARVRILRYNEIHLLLSDNSKTHRPGLQNIKGARNARCMDG